MKSILITGCNRGLGLGLIKHLTGGRNPPVKCIIATCRSRAKAQELQEISDKNANVHILELEVANFDQYEKFTEQVSEIVKEDGLNVLFNNAGNAPKSTRINLVKPEQLIDTYKVNTAAPILLTKSLLPLLRKAAKNNSEKPFGSGKAAVINMSSILASIHANTDGGLYPYRCSKAALNMATKSLAVDLFQFGVLVTSVHPGWVKTGLGGPKAPLEVDDVVPQIINLLQNLGEKDTGKFYQYDGKQLQW